MVFLSLVDFLDTFTIVVVLPHLSLSVGLLDTWFHSLKSGVIEPDMQSGDIGKRGPPIRRDDSSPGFVTGTQASGAFYLGYLFSGSKVAGRASPDELVRPNHGL